MSTTANHSARSHAKLSPSGASRWAVCTSSLDEITRHGDLVTNQDSTYSLEGTKAHEVCDSLLLNDPRKMPVGATDEMLMHGKAYKDYCMSIHAANGGDMRVEAKAPLWYLAEKQDGHVDFMCISKRGLHVVDYKYGQGVFVSAQDNAQMVTYAAAIMFALTAALVKEFSVNDSYPVTLHIYQPRCQSEDGKKFTVWETTWAALRLFAVSKIEVPADIVMDPAKKHLRKYAPSDKTCRFCPAKKLCGARTQWLLDAWPPVRSFIQDPEIETLPPPPSLTDTEIARVIELAPDLRAYLNDLEDYAVERWNTGKPVAGTKMVAGRGSRSWTSVEAAEKLLKQKFAKDEIFDSTIISPAQAEKLVKGKDMSTKWMNLFGSLIKRNPGSPSLVPASNPKPALALPASVFANEDDEFFADL